MQAVLDKFEKGEKDELLDLLNQGLLGHKESIDLLEGLDFDFINNLRTTEGEEGYQTVEDDFDFSPWSDQMTHHHVQDSHNMPPPTSMHSHHMASNHHHKMSSAPSLMMPSSQQSKGQASSAGHHHHDETGEMFEKNRRGSLDALLLNDFLLDDINTPHSTGLFAHEGNHESVFNDLFNHFAQDTLHTQSMSPRDKSGKKSLRVPTLPNSASSDISPDKVDLSAYANYAASLQTNSNDPNRRLVAAGNSPQKLVSIC